MNRTVQECVILFDVDNTLLNNDAMAALLNTYLVENFGEAGRARYNEHYEQLRAELGYADFLGAVQRFRNDDLTNIDALTLSTWLLNFPFAEQLFANALDAVHHASSLGNPVILSDGDGVFQPHKIATAGLRDAFDEDVLIFIHKEEELATIESLYPAKHYVMVDDKIKILTAMKNQWGDRLTTVSVAQGHYALDASLTAAYPKADISLQSIGEFVTLRATDLLGK